MKYHLLLIALLLPGCLMRSPVAQPVPDIEIKTVDPIPAPSAEGLDSVSVEIPEGLLPTLHHWLGDSNEFTIKNPLVLKQPGGNSIAIPGGASLSYTFTDSLGVFTFKKPKPVITTWAGPIKIHPTLDKIQIVPPNIGKASVTEFGRTFEKEFVLDWVDKAKMTEPPPVQEAPPPPIETIVPPRPPEQIPLAPVPQPTPKHEKKKIARAAVSDLPEVQMLSVPWCGICPGVKATLAKAQQDNKLRFRIKFVMLASNSTGTFPSFVIGSGSTIESSKYKQTIIWPGNYEGLNRDFTRIRNGFPTRLAATSLNSANIAQIAATWPNKWTVSVDGKDTGETSIEHLTNDHGVDYELLKPFISSPESLNRIHGYCHDKELERDAAMPRSWKR